MINVKKEMEKSKSDEGVTTLKNEAIVFFEFPCTCYKTVSKI